MQDQQGVTLFLGEGHPVRPWRGCAVWAQLGSADHRAKNLGDPPTRACMFPPRGCAGCARGPIDRVTGVVKSGEYDGQCCVSGRYVVLETGWRWG